MDRKQLELALNHIAQVQNRTYDEVLCDFTNGKIDATALANAIKESNKISHATNRLMTISNFENNCKGEAPNTFSSIEQFKVDLKQIWDKYSFNTKEVKGCIEKDDRVVFVGIEGEDYRGETLFDIISSVVGELGRTAKLK